MMLFLVSSGLSLIFGVMNILNFAHATFWLVGGYLTYTLFQFFSSTFGDNALLIVPAIIIVTGVMFGFGWALERVLIRRMYEREVPEQLLLTFALILIFGDLIKLIWGVQNRRIFLPIEPVEVFDSYVNPYSFVIIAAGVSVAAGLWWFFAPYSLRQDCSGRSLQSRYGKRARHSNPHDLRRCLCFGYRYCRILCRCISADYAYWPRS